MYRSVVVYSYYRQAHRDETALYFVNVRDENPLYKDVIKLYMQPQNTNSLIMIEIFLTDDFGGIGRMSGRVNGPGERDED